METTLRVLIVEDNETDAELVLRQITKSGFEITSLRVETALQMKEAMNNQTWDLIITDYSLPQFDAHGALEVFKASGIDIPFIVVSGTIGEETAVALMKAGADDYLMKDKLARLGPAVKRELADALDRRKRRTAEALLRENENKYRTIFENIQDVFFQIDVSGKILDISPSIRIYSGYLREELIGKNAREFYFDPTDRDEFLRLLSESGEIYDFDVRLKSKTNEIKWASFNAKFRFDANGTPAGIEGSLRDITHRRKIEEDLKSSETKFRALFNNSVDAIGVSLRGVHIFVNPAFLTLFGYDREEEIVEKPIIEFIAPAQRDIVSGYDRMRATNQMAPVNYETRGLRKDGSEFDMEVNVSAYELEGENYSLVILRDITIKKQAEIALALKEQQLSTLINATSDIICFKDGEGRWLQANHADLELFGLTGVDYYEKKDSELAEFSNPLFREAFLNCEETDEIAWKSETITISDEKIPTTDGKYKIFSVAKTPVFNPDGSRKGMVVFGRDVTERKKFEEEVIESRQQLSNIIDFLPDATFVIDNDKKVIAWNKAMEEMTGISKENMIGQGDHAYTIPFYGDRRLQMLDLLDMDDEALKAKYHNIHRKGDKLIGEIFAPALYGGKGAYIWNTGAPLYDTKGNRIGSIESIRDITDRKKIEVALKENEEKYRMMVDHSPDGIIIHSEGKIVFANPATLTLIGADSPDQVIGKPAIDFVHPEYREVAISRIKNIYETRKPAGLYQEKFINVSGEPIDVDVVGIPIIFNGKPAVQTIIRNITERKRAEEAVLQTERRFRAIIENAPDGVVLLDSNGKIKFASPAAKYIFGYDADDTYLIDPTSNTHPDDVHQVMWLLQKLIENPTQVFTHEYRFLHKDGIWRWVESTFSNQYANPGVEAIIINFRDITERKLTEKTLKESEERFRHISSSITDISYSCKEVNGTYQLDWLIGAVESILGYTIQELLNLNCWGKLVVDGDMPIFKAHILDIKPGESDSCQLRLKHKNGNLVWIIATAECVIKQEENPVNFLYGGLVDITESKHAEEAIQKERLLLRTLIDNLPDTIYVKDIEGRKLISNRADLKVIGVQTESEILGKTDLEIFNNEIGTRGYTDDMAVLTTGKPVINREENFFDASGEQHWLLTSKIPLVDNNGKTYGLAGLGHDITARKLAEEARQSIEQDYQLLFENIAQGFALHEIILDDSGLPCDYRFLSVNPAFEKLLNIKAIDVVGKAVKEILPLTEQYWIDTYGKVALTGEAVYYENYASNLHRHYEAWAFSPKKMQFAVVFTDITERKRADLIQKIIYNISQAVITTSDLEGLIRIIREQLGLLMDTTNFFVALYDEATGMLHSPVTNDQKDTISSWSAEKSLTGHVIKHNKSLLVTKAKKEEMRRAGEIELIGTPSEVWLGVPLHQEGKVIGAFAVQSYENPNAYSEKDVEMLEFVSDQISISIQRKKAEDEIKAALKKAEASDKLKTAFLNNMSHEIRTPLNGIMGFTGLLDDPGITDEDRSYYMRIIHQNRNQLTSIIEAIINIATIEAGLEEMRLNKLNLNVLFGEMYDHYNNFTNPKAVILNFKTELTRQQANIIIDDEKLRQVLNHLIGNAVKFTDSGKIEFGCTLNPASKMLEFFVADTGIGIHPDYHELVFQRFLKINPDRSREYGGNGLGLTIAKAYVELLGGKIWLDSQLGKGSVFHFTLPYVPAEPEISIIAEAEMVKPDTRRTKTLLVAEDEYSNYQLLEVILQRENHHIIHALNGKEAVGAFHNNPEIDLILMDLKMPVMDGLTATQIIKAEKPGIPIIAVTAYALSGDKEKALAAGCNEYISKPIRKQNLLDLINKY